MKPCVDGVGDGRPVADTVRVAPVPLTHDPPVASQSSLLVPEGVAVATDAPVVTVPVRLEEVVLLLLSLRLPAAAG